MFDFASAAVLVVVVAVLACFCFRFFCISLNTWDRTIHGYARYVHAYTSHTLFLFVFCLFVTLVCCCFSHYYCRCHCCCCWCCCCYFRFCCFNSSFYFRCLSFHTHTAHTHSLAWRTDLFACSFHIICYLVGIWKRNEHAQRVYIPSTFSLSLAMCM